MVPFLLDAMFSASSSMPIVICGGLAGFIVGSFVPKMSPLGTFHFPAKPAFLFILWKIHGGKLSYDP